MSKILSMLNTTLQACASILNVETRAEHVGGAYGSKLGLREGHASNASPCHFTYQIQYYYPPCLSPDQFPIGGTPFSLLSLADWIKY